MKKFCYWKCFVVCLKYFRNITEHFPELYSNINLQRNLKLIPLTPEYEKNADFREHFTAY